MARKACALSGEPWLLRLRVASRYLSNTMLKHRGVIGARSPYKQIKKVGSSVRLLVHILCVACIDHLDRIAFDDVGVVPLVGDTYTVASS